MAASISIKAWAAAAWDDWFKAAISAVRLIIDVSKPAIWSISSWVWNAVTLDTSSSTLVLTSIIVFAKVADLFSSSLNKVKATLPSSGNTPFISFKVSL